MKKVIICSLMVLLLVTGCGKVPKLQDGKDSVVNLKNGGISVDDLYHKMKKSYALNVLLSMVDEKILNDKYKSDDEEKTYIDNMYTQVEMYYQYFYKSQYSSFESYILSQYGATTTEELREVFALDYKRTKAIDDYAKSLVSDKEIKDYYDKEVVGDIKASHILITVETKENATDDEKKAADEEAQKKVKEVIEKLKKGEDFAALAKEYSKDEHAGEGGDLGFFNEGDMVDEFFAAAKKLKVGEYTTEGVKTQYGYHIIKKTEEKEKEPLEKWKDKIVEKLGKEKKDADENINYKALIQLREDNKIEINDKELKEQYENYVFQYK